MLARIHHMFLQPVEWQEDSGYLAVAGWVLIFPFLLGACAPTINPLPPDRHPGDTWRGGAVPLEIGEVVMDTLDVPSGDHTDWKSIQCNRRGTLLLRLRIYRNKNSGHLQILNPKKGIVLSHDLVPGQEAYEITVPVIHPGRWLLGLSLRGGQVSYEMQAVWR